MGKDSHDTGKISSGKHWVARKSCHAIIDLHSVKIALAGKEYKIDEEKSKGHKWHNMVGESEENAGSPAESKGTER